jgi:uncharacterized protein (DUF169 family)
MNHSRQNPEVPSMSRSIQTLLDLKVAPIAITFCDRPPAGVPRVERAEPAGCGYWRRASEGEVFYTEAADHLNCAVGAHTHNVPMSPEKRRELQGLLDTMIDLNYLSMEEVPRIPRRKSPFRVAVYAPLDRAPLSPDVVLIRADVRQLMLLAEAAQGAGIGSPGPTLGRPTCSVLPEAIEGCHSASSFGCAGNRVYTGAADHEGYFAVPGARLAALEARLETVVRANQELEKFHRLRQQTL